MDGKTIALCAARHSQWHYRGQYLHLYYKHILYYVKDKNGKSGNLNLAPNVVPFQNFNIVITIETSF